MGFTALSFSSSPSWAKIYFALYGVLNAMIVLAQADLIRRLKGLADQGLKFKSKNIRIGYSNLGMVSMVTLTVIGQAAFMVLFQKYHQ